MIKYDPLMAPDPMEWMALDEYERLELVVAYHRREKISLHSNKTNHG